MHLHSNSFKMSRLHLLPQQKRDSKNTSRLKQWRDLTARWRWRASKFFKMLLALKGNNNYIQCLHA